MTTKKLLVISGVAGALVGAAAFAASLWKIPAYEANKSACPDFSEGVVLVGENRLHVSIARTSAEQGRGLGGCPEIPADSGMLFPYAPAQSATFWMKDMLIPLDIIWIQGGKVIGIERNVPAPAPRTLDSALPTYRSPGPIDNVLEVKAGGAGEHGIAIGSPVSRPN